MARELPGLGWGTTVVTRSESHRQGRWESGDDSLLERIGLEALVERVPARAPEGGVTPSLLPGLPPIAQPLGRRVIEVARREQPSVVLLTMSPFFLSELVEPLRAVCDARIVVDLRDPWALDYWPIYRDRGRFRRQEELMLRCLRSIDGVVMNTPSARTEVLRFFAGRLPDGFESRIATIENGYDAADFEVIRESCDRDVLEIVHTGTFHCEHLPCNRSFLDRLLDFRRHERARIDRSGRTPQHLLQAASTLSERCRDFDCEVRFRFVGHVDPSLERCIEHSGIASKVELPGYLPHEQSVTALGRAGALFLPGAGLPAGIEDLIVPGKTYEYIASGRPILAAIGHGDGRRLLEEAGGAYICDPSDPDSIADQLKRLHHDWRTGLLEGDGTRDMSVVQRYERANLAANLSAFLESILEHAPATCD